MDCRDRFAVGRADSDGLAAKSRERLAWTSVVALAVACLFSFCIFNTAFRSARRPHVFFGFFRRETRTSTQRQAQPFLPMAVIWLLLPPDSTGKEVLWIRSFDSLTARSLAGTEDATYPFWSPDGHGSASSTSRFFAGRPSLKKIDVSGGPAYHNRERYSRRGRHVEPQRRDCVGTGATRLLYRVSAAGGQVVPITKESETVTVSRGGVHFLPDGKPLFV